VTRLQPSSRAPFRPLLLAGVAVALGGPALVAWLGTAAGLAGKPGSAALFLIAVIVATATGGLLAGLVCVAASSLAFTYFFLEPVHRFELHTEGVVGLATFLAAALVTGLVLEAAQRTSSRLATSEQVLVGALELGRLGAWELAPQTGELWLSAQARRLLGLGEEDFDGRVETVLRLVHPDDVTRAAEMLEGLAAGKTEIALEVRIVRPDGEARWIEVRGDTVRPPARGASAVAGVLSDVTERKDLAEAREAQIAEVLREHGLLSSVIDQMPVGVVVAEAPSGTIVVGNDEVERIWGRPLAELGGMDADGAQRAYRANGRPYTPEEWPLARTLRTGEVVVGERIELLRADGSRSVVEVSSAPIRDRSGAIAAGVGTFSEVTERIERERRERFLADASTLLASSLDYRETLARVAELLVPGIADWCSIELVENGEIRNVAVHHNDPAKVELACRLRQEYPVDPASPTGAPAVIRTGRSELYADITDELLQQAARDERQLELMRELRLSSALVVPLTARGETFGAVSLVAEGGRRLDARDLALAEELARRAAVAVDNARLYEGQARALAAAEEARTRTARLQAVTEALAEAVTRADVANVLVREGLVALRAQAAAVFALAASGQGFETLASAGYPEELISGRPTFEPGTEGPAEEAVRTGELVVAESPEEVAARWPSASWPVERTGDCALMTAPLLVGERPVGVLHMAFRQPRAFDDMERALMQTLARQCAQALERARLFEHEQEARAQAERLAARLRRLQTVVDATFTTGSLDDVLRELVTRLRDAIGADTAAILMVDEAGDSLVVRQAIGFRDPTDTRVPIGEGFAGRIAATRSAYVVPDLSELEVVSRHLRDSGVVSIAGVPLIVEGRLVGVAHVGFRHGHSFDREELLLLRLVAARAAVAVDRAHLHEREHRIAEVLQRSLLPERLPALDGVEVAARYVPGTIGVAVGGDWYDVFELPDGWIGIAVGDVVGHGVRAAATMGRLRHVLRAYAVEGFGPAQALGRLNALACESSDETFATVVYALVSPTRARVRLASAGHPPVLVRGPDGAVHQAEGGRSLPVGATPDATYSEVELRLEPGSTLVLYTDGLVERRTESIDVGIERLVRLIEETSGPLDELADRIVAQLEDTDHTDDVALLAVQLEPQTTPRLSLRFPAEPAALAPMRGSLRAWLEAHGAREDEIFDILVAVNEACSNAIEHPLGRTAPDVTLDAEMVNGGVSLVIGDRGRWRPAGPRGDRGRGLEFMDALMEGVEVSRSDDGTTVHLRRRLRRRSG